MRYLALLIVALTLLFAAAPPDVSAQLPEERAFVVVQLRDESGIFRSQVEGPAPSLAEQGFARLEVPEGIDVDRYVEQLRADPSVLSADAETRLFAADTPNDSFYASNQSTYMNLINAPKAWDLVTGSAEPTLVAILDSGMDLNHPDLRGNIAENLRDASSDGIDDDGNGCVDDRYGCRFVDLTTQNRDGCGYSSSARNGAVTDDNGRPGTERHSHGTLVSGIAGAIGNNGAGVAGVAWKVKLLTVKVLDCGPGGTLPSGSPFNIAEGIDYARRMGARIINISIAGRPGDQLADTASLRKAIQDAANDGVIIVAAAGNHAPGAGQVGPGYPGAYTQFANLVTVGASDQAGQWASFSNYGPAVDLAAPGVGIAGPARTDLGLANPYGALDGTSFSTPLVAGVFALLISRNPNLTVAEYIAAATAAATPAAAAPHGLNWAGAGLVNAGGAVGRIPLSSTGAALRDFKDVPDGTEVRALIGSAECGATTARTFGVFSRYTIRVRPEAETPGCGAPGKTVTFLVGGFPATQTIAWGGKDESLGFLSKDLSSVSPPPGAIIVQTLNGTWSNIAQLEAGGPLPGTLVSLASPWDTVYRWDPLKALFDRKGAYRIFTKEAPAYAIDLPEIQRYDAIWINAARANIATGNPQPNPDRIVDLHPGWNNFVWTGSNQSVAEALAPVEGKYTQVLQFDNANNTWRTHLPGQARYLNDFGGLFKLQVYWVFMTAPGTVVMN